MLYHTLSVFVGDIYITSVLTDTLMRGTTIQKAGGPLAKEDRLHKEAKGIVP
jgi:hypothetical protein